MAETLDINWERRALRFLRRLDTRRSEGKYDFVIIVGSRKIFAERNILATGSDYFNAMLSHNTMEKQKGEVEMMDVDFESVRTCIDFIYGREVSISMENYDSLMYVAQLMQLEELCDAIVRKMVEWLSLQTFFFISSLAVKFDITTLKAACKQFAEERFELLFKEEKFNTIDKTFLFDLLKSPDTSVEEEIKVYAILEFVKDDVDRKKYLLELLRCIDFCRIPPGVLEGVIKDEPLINEDKECLRFLSLSIAKAMSSRSASLKEKILIFTANPSHTSLLLDPYDNTIQNTSIANLDIRHSSVVCLEDYVYVVNSKKSLCRLKYSELGAMWEPMADMLVKHGPRPPTTVLSGRIYVVGCQGNFEENAIEYYNPRNNKWRMLQSTTEPNTLAHMGILGYGGYIYSFGGLVNDGRSTYVDDVARLDVTTSEWEVLSPMSERKGSVSAAECRGIIFVAGGLLQGNICSSTFESYNPLTNHWTVFPQMNVQRSKFPLVKADGFLYAVGGATSLNSIEVYDFQTGEWRLLDSVRERNCKIICSVAISV